MREQKKITLKELQVRTKGMNIDQLENVLYQLDTKQGDKAIMSTKRSHLVKEILALRTDLRKNVKNAHYNRGSQLEILSATQLYKQELATYRVTNSQKSDWKLFGHLYEAESFTNNNPCHGYATMQEWYDKGSSKNMVLIFENAVYQCRKKDFKGLIDVLYLHTHTNKKGKTEIRIKGVRKNWKIVKEHCEFRGYLDLTV